MKHLVRAGGLILAILALSLILPRLIPTTEALEPYGFYRGWNAAEEWSNKPVEYVDSLSCQSCHQDKYKTWVEGAHKKVVCENCHGPGKAHIDDQADLVVDKSKELCGICHEKTLGRPAEFPQVDIENHATATCTSCHDPHDPLIKSEAPAIPHNLEGRNDCLLCHSAGGLKPYPDDHNGRGGETCLSCHSTK